MSTSPEAGSASAPAVVSQQVGTELRQAARGGAVTLGGSMVSTVMGFVLSLVLARALGASGSGVVLQVIAAFTIGLSLARIGMDTTAVWIIPRLKEESPESVRGACVGMVLAAAVVGALGTAGWWIFRWTVGLGLLGDDQVGSAVDLVAWALPVGSVMMVALAATRGFGGLLPFNLIGNVALPAARPLAVLLVVSLGGAVMASSLAWALPLVPAMVLSLWVLWRQVAAFESRRSVTGRTWPAWPLQRRLLGFSLPRTFSSALEQSLVWFDVVLVGVLSGAAAAGVYGAASRFVGAGVIVLTALRIVVAPRFSAFLAQQRHDDAQQLYTVTASWILLFGGPVYVLLAVFSPTVLRWLGPDFGDGAVPMAVLCAGSLVMLAGGNVQSLLLMSGRSGWGALNKLVVFAVNVALNVVLIPHLGILGAAIAWAACMVLDTLLAVVQVYRFTRIRPAVGPLSRVLVTVVVGAGLPCLLMVRLLGNTTSALVVSTLLAGLVLLGYCVLDRRRLHMDALVELLPGVRR